MYCQNPLNRLQVNLSPVSPIRDLVGVIADYYWHIRSIDLLDENQETRVRMNLHFMEKDYPVEILFYTGYQNRVRIDNNSRRVFSGIACEIYDANRINISSRNLTDIFNISGDFSEYSKLGVLVILVNVEKI